MKSRLTAALCLALALPGALAQTASNPAHEQKLAGIRKLLTLTGSDKAANEMLDMIAANLRASGGPDSERFFEVFRKEFDLKKAFELQVEAYDQFLTAEDVSAAVRFYESPAGKHLAESIPKITNLLMIQGQKMSQEVARKVAKKLQEEQQK